MVKKSKGSVYEYITKKNCVLDYEIFQHGLRDISVFRPQHGRHFLFFGPFSHGHGTTGRPRGGQRPWSPISRGHGPGTSAPCPSWGRCHCPLRPGGESAPCGATLTTDSTLKPHLNQGFDARSLASFIAINVAIKTPDLYKKNISLRKVETFFFHIRNKQKTIRTFAQTEKTTRGHYADQRRTNKGFNGEWIQRKRETYGLKEMISG